MHRHSNGVTYAPVWQTWNVVRASASVPSTEASAPADDVVMDRPSATSSLRERMQIARIDRRMSIDDLSRLIECDTETLAAFERGDEVLSERLQSAIRRVLRLG